MTWCVSAKVFSQTTRRIDNEKNISEEVKSQHNNVYIIQYITVIAKGQNITLPSLKKKYGSISKCYAE